MSKILLIGYAPPPVDPGAKIEAAHYRTWQFLAPLVDDGHHICLCANHHGDGPAVPLPPDWADVDYRPVALRGNRSWRNQLQQVHDQYQPDCVVAVNFDCALAATRLQTDRPVWMDVYGDYLTIVQVARYRAGSDRGISTSAAFMKNVLQHGDVYSGCGQPQAQLMVGELAMSGRLNSQTFGYEFTRVIRAGSPPADRPRSVAPRTRTRLGALGIPKEATVALWCGGYNPWTDVDVLFDGLQEAMRQDDGLHYVSLGANSYEGPDNVYHRLRRKIETSAFRDRFYLLGWRPWSELADYYAECDVGLNIDGQHYETIFGTRTRIAEMLAAGLPVITSRGCELGDMLASRGAGFLFESGDADGLAGRLLAIRRPHQRREAARRAVQFATEELSFAQTTKPLRDWVKNPRRAPDRVDAGYRHRIRQFEFSLRSAVRQLAWQTLGRAG